MASIARVCLLSAMVITMSIPLLLASLENGNDHKAVPGDGRGLGEEASTQEEKPRTRSADSTRNPYLQPKTQPSQNVRGVSSTRENKNDEPIHQELLASEQGNHQGRRDQGLAETSNQEEARVAQEQEERQTQQAKLAVRARREARRSRARQEEEERRRIRQEADDKKLAYWYHRPDRLRTGLTMTLYHQTNKQAARAIRESGRMLRGAGGMAGGGIYFATNKLNTTYKAHANGYMITAQVRLGSVKTISKHGDSSINFDSLGDAGYDSVLIPRSNGTEYVVYNFDQVDVLKVKRKTRRSKW